MPIYRKNAIIFQEGEQQTEFLPYKRRENPDVCVPHKELIVGDHVKLINPNLVDPNTNQYMMIDCIVCFVERDVQFDEVYYYFIAIGENEHLNTLQDNKFPNLYYKILESTSPYIIND